jgi:riboflavin transporter FmnP
MNTRALSLIIIFTALAAALNVYGPKIPFPLAPFLFFSFWEIPIVIAFLFIGPKAGITVSAINMFLLLAIFPGALPTGPIYNWIAVLSMLLGISIPYWFAKRGCKTEHFGNYLRHHITLIAIASTSMGIVLRVLVMTVVNYFALQQPYPIGFSFPEVDVLLFLPVGAAFNAIVAGYTIIISLAITVALMTRVKME